MFTAISRSLFWKIFLPIGSMLVLCGIAAAVLLPIAVRGNAEKDAIAGAQATVQQFRVLRGYYTENVVSKIVAKGVLKPSFDHKGDPEKIPLPATMILDMSEMLQKQGTVLKLYSAFPFPNRKDRVLDGFGKDAWTFLSANPEKTFSRVETVNGQPIVRVAMADKMTAQACVNCHNSFPGSPKTDWKVGDVRGVLEVDSGKELASGDRITYQVLAALGVAIMLIVVFLRYVYQRSIAAPLHDAIGAAERVADGDLRGRIESRSEDEIGRLLDSLRAMQQKLTGLLSEIRNSTDTMNDASDQIAQGNLDLSARTEAQASALQETASSIEELTSTVKHNSDNAHQANKLAQSASAVALKAGSVVSQVVETMGSINDSSKKIVDIISVIDGIAFQTNILALNAAVEAARAGEQGRGFAVVASEVRNLAQRSAAAAKEIKELIGDSVEKVEIGARLVDQAGSTMEEVVASVKHVTDIIGEITNAGSEQTSGIEQVNQAIIQIDDATQQNAALVEEIAASAQSMKDQARSLSNSVSVFKFAEAAPAGAAASNVLRQLK